ncbi:MAG: fibronectin type III domain-containing protein [Bacteroidia bacterium]
MKKIALAIIVFAVIASSVSCKKKKNIPDAPGGLNYSTTSNSLTLTWIDNSDNELGFYIQESGGSSSDWTNKTFVGSNSNTFTYSIYMLDPGKSYRIVAWNDDGESEPSNSVYVPTYTSAYAYIYVCPSSASGACGDNYIVLDGNCRQKTSEYSNGGWYNTGFEVVVNNTYAMQFCQGCVSNCGQAASFKTPPLFLKQKYNTGLYNYCNNDPCTPGAFIE